MSKLTLTDIAKSAAGKRAENKPVLATVKPVKAVKTEPKGITFIRAELEYF